MTKELSVADMARKILIKYKRPMHYKEITTLILNKKDMNSKIPWKTVNARLSTDSRFFRVGKDRSGIYTLREWDISE